MVIPGREVIRTHDNTMMEDADRCLRLYHFRHREGLRPKGGAPPLNYGKLIHDALDTWYNTWDYDATLKTIMDADYEDPIDDFRTKERALRKIVDYIEFYGKEESWLGGPDSVILTETAFNLEDPNDGFRWGGVVDLLVEYNGELWVMDHKTTSRFGASWFDQFENSSQMAGYVWAASQLHGSPVAGVLINCIVTHKVPKPAAKQLHRQPLYFPEWKIEEWKAMRSNDYHNLAKAQEAERFPPRWHSCVNKYGKCPFFQVCRANPQAREHLIEEFYEYDPWDWEDRDDN